MTMKSMIEQAEQDLLHTYNRYQIVLDHGEDVYLYDAEGKKYLDFMSGIGVFALGYSNEYYNNALKEQIGKILHTSNYFYNEPAIKAAHRMKEISGMDRVFFANSGAEAVEGALKAAIKYAYVKDGASDHQVIALEHSFHGRTYGALSVTGNSHYREAFGAMPCEARFARMNDMDSILEALTDKTCAIIMEVVQGEGGIVPAKEEFLRAVRDLCNERDILLIFDEVLRRSTVRHGAHRLYVRMAEIRYQARYYDKCQGSGLRHSRRRFYDDPESRGPLTDCRRSRDHLWRQPARMRSCQRGTGPV